MLIILQLNLSKKIMERDLVDLYYLCQDYCDTYCLDCHLASVKGMNQAINWLHRALFGIEGIMRKSLIFDI